MTNILIKEITLKNILSYGDETKLDLRPLNVFIGPNGSGKSNLIEAISILKELPNDLAYLIRREGGVREWLWKGGEKNASQASASLEVIIQTKNNGKPLRYRLEFTESGSNNQLELVDEFLEASEKTNSREKDVYFFYRYQNGNPIINVHNDESKKGTKRQLQRDKLQPDQSILKQRKDSDLYPELYYISTAFEEIALYREWPFGRDSETRQPTRTDDSGKFLTEKIDNFPNVFNHLNASFPNWKDDVLEEFCKFYPKARDIVTTVEGTRLRLFLKEEIQPGKYIHTPTTRLSDGTLHYLALLIILLHPEPPPLIILEEPEVGLHPDAVARVAKLLGKAAKKTQIIVTTHSDTLVAELSDPESVVVCKRDLKSGETRLNRLSNQDLRSRLDRHNLGELWMMGQIGGNP